MSDNTKISTTTSAQTTVIKKGQVAIHQATIKIPPKPLFVLFAYGGKSGAREMKLAAEYKKKRLQKKYPAAEIRIIHKFKWPSHFKAEWTKLYIELTRPETANKYSLWQIHYFGHGGPESLYLEEEGGIEGANSKIYFEGDITKRLPWHPDKGIFVLHSCRGAAYEDTFSNNMISKKICLAKTISEKQNTRCLGQIFYASFCYDYTQTGQQEIAFYSPISLKTTAEEDAKKFIYRGDVASTKYFIERTNIDRVLWGYAKMNGLTKQYMVNNEDMFMKRLNRPYPIAEYIRVLKRNNQIMPCRIFNKGVLEHNGKVALGFINKEDLEYI